MNLTSLRQPGRLRSPLACPLLALPLLLACNDAHPSGGCSSPGTTPIVGVAVESRSGAAWSPGPYRVTVTVDGVDDFCDFEVPEPPCTYQPGPDFKQAPEPVCTSQYLHIWPTVACDSYVFADGKYQINQVVLLDAAPASLAVDLAYRGETLVKATVEPAYVVSEARGNACPEPRDRALVGNATLSLP